MNKNTKVYFTLHIGYSGADRKEEFTLEELGYDPEHDTDLDEFLEEQYLEWRMNYLDGGWSIEQK